MKDIPIRDLLQQTTWLRRLAHALVRDPAAADDLVQDAWVAALRSPPDGARPVRPWWAEVLRNLASTARRGERNRRARETRAAAEEEVALPSPEQLAAEHEQLRVLAELVGALEEPYRATVILCYSKGLTPTEVARRLTVPAGTIRWRLKEALDRIRSALDERNGGNRHAWIVALAPLGKIVAAHPGSTETLAEPPVFPPALRTSLVAAPVAVLAVLAVGWLWQRDEVEGRRIAGSSTSAGVPQPALRLARLGEPPRKPGGGEIHLAGLVVDPGGRPVDGASVSFTEQVPIEINRGSGGQSLHPTQVVSTGGGGRFTVSLPSGTYGITAAAPGWAPAEVGPIGLDPRASRSIVLRLVAGGLPLRGRVLDDGGGAIPGAVVSVGRASAFADQFPRAYRTVSGADGRFVIPLDRDRYTINIQADGYASGWQEFLLAQGAERVFRIHPAGRLAGSVVVAGSGEKMARAIVSLILVDGLSIARRLAEADDEGQFAFDGLPPGGYRVHARRENLVGLSPIVALGGGSRAESRVTVEVSPGYRVRGLVQTAEGKPVADALITLSAAHTPMEAVVTARSGADGAFVLEGAVPGRYRVGAVADGYSNANRDVEIEGADRDVGSLALTATATVEGVVRNEAGQVVPAARVVVGAPNTLPGTVSDQDGRFSLRGLRPGRLVLRAHHPLHGAALVEAGALALGERRQLEVTLKAGASLEGNVRLEGGEPVTAAEVTGASGLNITSITTTGPDGRYRLDQLPEGPSIVTVAIRSKSPAAASVELHREITLGRTEHRTSFDFVLPRPDHTITGVVLGPEGQGLPGALVTSYRQSRGHFDDPSHKDSQTTGADGTFRLEGLVSGRYGVRAFHPAYPELPVQSVPAGATDVRFQLPPAGGVAGVLVDGQGHPVPDAMALVFPAGPAGEPDHARFERESRAEVQVRVRDPAGAFGFGPLAPGAHELRFSAAHGRAAAARVQLAPGQQLRGLRVVVEGGVRIIGRIVNADTEAPVPEAKVLASRLSHELEGRSDAAGRFSIPAVPPGQLMQLHITDPSRRHAGDWRWFEVPPTSTVLDLGTFRLLDRRQQGSVGLSIRARAEVEVRSAAPGSPADKAGIRPGALVLSIDGKEVQAFGLNASRALDGRVGTSLTLRVRDPGSEVARVVTLVRVPTAESASP